MLVGLTTNQRDIDFKSQVTCTGKVSLVKFQGRDPKLVRPFKKTNKMTSIFANFEMVE